MALPARPRAAFKVIEAELVFQFLILLFDGPALVRQAHEAPQRGTGWEMDQVVLGARGRAAIPFGE